MCAFYPHQTFSANMSDPALAALGPEKAFSICAAFIKSGGDDGKGTGVFNSLGQGQEERKVLYKWYKQATEGDITGTRPGLISSTMKVSLPDRGLRMRSGYLVLGMRAGETHSGG